MFASVPGSLVHWHWRYLTTAPEKGNKSYLVVVSGKELVIRSIQCHHVFLCHSVRALEELIRDGEQSLGAEVPV